jgi:hypothetical protein
LKGRKIISLPRAPAVVDVNQFEGDQNYFHISASFSNLGGKLMSVTVLEIDN